METTTNYKLPQWVKEDPIKMQDFNAAFQTIDETLKAAADATAEKADAATVQQTVAALQTALGSGGKTCRISSGSYAGNGQNRSVEPQFPYVRLYAGVGRYHTQGQPRDAHPFRASQWLRPYGRHDGHDHMGRKKGELVLPKSPSRR